MMYRKATMNDCRAVYDLICDMEDKSLPYHDFERIFSGQLDNENYYCLICQSEAMDRVSQTEDQDRVYCSVNDTNDGSVIGFLNLRFEDQLHHAGRIAEIMEFVVDAEYRNKGAGKDILREAKEVAREHGCIQIEVACNQLREDTHRFYLREGMENYHYKFSMPLYGESGKNVLGR